MFGGWSYTVTCPSESEQLGQSICCCFMLFKESENGLMKSSLFGYYDMAVRNMIQKILQRVCPLIRSIMKI